MTSSSLNQTNFTTDGAAAPGPQDVAATDSAPGTVSVSEFNDATGLSVGQSQMSSLLDYVTPGDEDLASFLSRPVLIATQTWSSSAFSALQIDPWTLFLTNTVVARKISNYSLFRAELHVRIMFDGTPLQFGALQASYLPCAPSTSGSSYNIPTTAWNVYRGSQMRNCEIYGSGSSSGTIICPFIYRNPYASLLTGDSDIAELGRLRIQQLISLKAVSAAAVMPGTVSVVAWLEKPDLRVATYRVAMHRPSVSTVEARPNFNISRPATVVAKAANMLTGLPFIGPAATVASMVASGVSTIAAAFGFSRPFDLRDKVVMIPRYFGASALVEGVDSPEKLSLDPKQGVSIGTEWLNLPGGPDQMSVSSIASREALLQLYDSVWTTSSPLGTQLAAIPVHPFSCVGVTADTACTLTPIAYAAAPFQYWTGAMHIRVKAITSSVVRGRLVIFHYPHNDTGYTTLTYQDVITTCQNCVLDVESSTDVEFIIRPSMSKPWLLVGLAKDSAWGTTSDSARANGRVVIMVANQLSAPIAASCGLLLYVRGGADFQVAVPTLSNVAGWKWKNTMAPPSGGGLDASLPAVGPGGTNSPSQTCELTTRPVREIPVEPYFGERVESFRSLAKRFSLHTTYSPTMQNPAGASNARIVFQIVDAFYPAGPRAAGAEMWTWMVYASLPFMCVRGGVRARALMRAVSGSATPDDALFGWVRSPNTSAPPIGAYTLSNVSTKGFTAMSEVLGRSANGFSITPQNRQPVAEVEYPYYSNSLYSFAGSSSAPHPHPDAVSLWAAFQLAPSAVVMLPFEFDIFRAAADDFTCHEWFGCGTVDISADMPGLDTAFLST